MWITLYYVSYYKFTSSCPLHFQKKFAKMPNTYLHMCPWHFKALQNVVSNISNQTYDINLSLQGVAMAKEKGFAILLW